jgi:hypothetical protein
LIVRDPGHGLAVRFWFHGEGFFSCRVDNQHPCSVQLKTESNRIEKLKLFMVNNKLMRMFSALTFYSSLLLYLAHFCVAECVLPLTALL